MQFFILFLFMYFFSGISSAFGELPLSKFKSMPPMDVIYHPVSTNSSEAQQHFNTGLTYIFAFNHDIAYREFEKAAEFDPKLGMAYWGMALALGQNINADVTPENELKCYSLMQEALKLSPQASRNERAYIWALAKRYTDNPKIDLVSLRLPYKEAMKQVVKAFPEDLDAATIYAESILNLDPWKWWTAEGKPKDGVLEAIQTLESVLNRSPNHIGANHYYIHALEESPFFERALMSAYRLTRLLPESGHLLHMPVHIFISTGNYEDAIETNSRAIEADRDYIKEYGMGGNYPLHYLRHNMYVLARTYMLMENFERAFETTLQLNHFLKPYFDRDPHLARFAYTPLEVLLYFHKWKEILEYKPLSAFPICTAYWHYSRAIAYAALGDIQAAENEKRLMEEAKKRLTPLDEIANNPAIKVFELAGVMIDASIAKAKGHFEDHIDHLTKAVQMEEALFYDEPPAWSTQIEQALGATYLEKKDYAAAENLFRKALQKLQRNGRSLFGLALALEGQEKTTDTFWVLREMKESLKHASKPLKIEDLN